MSASPVPLRAAASSVRATVEMPAQLAISAHLAMPVVGACVGAAVLAAGVVLRPRGTVRAVTVHHDGHGTWPPRSPARPFTAQATRTCANASARRALCLLWVATIALAAGPLAAAVAVLVATLTPRWRRTRAIAGQRRAVAAAYPDAIDLVVLGIRAGLLPSAAMEAATDYVPAAVRPAFIGVVARADRGDRFADALLELEVHIGSDARPLIDSFAAADRYGLPLAPVLERLATEARQQRRRSADTAARQLPVRLSLPLVLCTLPSFVLLAIVPLLLGAFSSLHTK